MMVGWRSRTSAILSQTQWGLKQNRSHPLLYDRLTGLGISYEHDNDKAVQVWEWLRSKFPAWDEARYGRSKLSKAELWGQLSRPQLVAGRRRLARTADDVGSIEAQELLGELYLLDGQVGRAIEVYGGALPGRRLLDGQRGGVALINLLNVLADLYDRQGVKDRSEELATQAQLYEQQLLERQDGAAAARLKLEMVITQLQRRQQGEHLTEPEQWMNLMKEGRKLWDAGDIFAATAPWEQALTLARCIFPTIHNDLAISLRNEDSLLFAPPEGNSLGLVNSLVVIA